MAETLVVVAVLVALAAGACTSSPTRERPLPPSRPVPRGSAPSPPSSSRPRSTPSTPWIARPTPPAGRWARPSGAAPAPERRGRHRHDRRRRHVVRPGHPADRRVPVRHLLQRPAPLRGGRAGSPVVQRASSDPRHRPTVAAPGSPGRSLPASSTSPRSSCRADRRCIAVGDVAGGAAALTSASAGATWLERGPLPVGVTGATAVSCPDDTHCWVTAQRAPDPDHVAGVVVLTTDGGSVWEALTTPGRRRLPQRRSRA